MEGVQTLLDLLQMKFGARLQNSTINVGELTIEVDSDHLHSICTELRDDPDFQFEMLMDLCGVDYLHFGLSEWETQNATTQGFSRGVDPFSAKTPSIHWSKPRFAVVYHLLSLSKNQRIRVRTFAKDDPPKVPSVVNIWNSANWYEREAFDLFGILFENHPDLRRLLTDYGFVGYPFRKDFPLIGTVEMRYSATEGRVIYEPVSIPPRTLVPKTIREDNRYLIEKEYHGMEKREDERVLKEKK